MSTLQNHPPAFGSHMAAVLQDEAKLKQFAETVTGPESLRAFAATNGYDLSAEEAEQVYDKAAAMLDASSGRAPISDEMLENVNGGISLAGIGAAIGGLGAAASLTLAVGCVMAAPFTGGASLAGAAAAIAGLSGASAVTVGVGALAAGAVGAGIGAVGGHIVENS